MQGPQAFARTMPPASVKVPRVLSRSRVARICSLPGVMKKLAFGVRPAAEACLTTSSARVISSYELFVQLPMRPAPNVLGQFFSSTTDLNFDNGVEKSGVKGPLIWGSRAERLIVMTLSYAASGSARSRFCDMDPDAMREAASAIGARCVATR